MNVRMALAIAGVAAGLWSVGAAAEEKPLWEFGLGVGGLTFPDYRGSDERRFYPVPVPYFVYRGDLFKADRDGIRGRLFDSDKIELTLSASATIPVNSDDNAARRGMPDLQPTVELGPSLELHLWRSADRRVKFDLLMPLRIPVTLESSPQLIGWVFAPRLNLDIEDIGGHDGWNFGIGAGPIVADGKYHDYFYSVAPAFATADRPAYDATSGYSGTHFLTSLSKRFPKYWVGAYLRYDALGGATYSDSPLVRQQHSLAGGFGIAWMIGESKKMVEEK
jgi:outer membrane scaffolding protein for murein synthesis (MipA/OmpV family)